MRNEKQRNGIKILYYMAMKNPAFCVRSVKTRIRTVVRKFPYSDRLVELSELATILTCFDKKKLQQFFSNTFLKRKKATDQRTQNTEAI